MSVAELQRSAQTSVRGGLTSCTAARNQTVRRSTLHPDSPLTSFCALNPPSPRLHYSSVLLNPLPLMRRGFPGGLCPRSTFYFLLRRTAPSDASVAAPPAGRGVGRIVQLSWGEGGAGGGEAAGFTGQSQLPQGVQGVHLCPAQEVALALQHTHHAFRCGNINMFVSCTFRLLFI